MAVVRGFADRGRTDFARDRDAGTLAGQVAESRGASPLKRRIVVQCEIPQAQVPIGLFERSPESRSGISDSLNRTEPPGSNLRTERGRC